jgi:hypothetical protein
MMSWDEPSELVDRRLVLLFCGTALFTALLSTLFESSTADTVFAAIGTGFITALSDWQNRRDGGSQDHHERE